MVDYSRELAVASQIAKAAGNIMLEYFEGDQQQEIKQDGSPVTIADKAINDFVIAELAKAFPDDGVVGEEASTASYGMGRKWLCDPIDGTKSYVWGVPTAMFSLGLVIDGKPQVGVAYDPFLDKLYTGIKGQGSYCNGQKLAVSAQPLAGGWAVLSGSIERVVANPEFMEKLLATGMKLASFDGGVYKCMLVARGRLQVYVGQGCGPYDVAAAEVILTEAGGTITNVYGEPLNYASDFLGVVVSNGADHKKLVDILTNN